MVLEDIDQGVGTPIIAPNAVPLFTNKVIGLKRVERNRTSHVNLIELAWDRDKDRDSFSKQTLPDDSSNEDSPDSSNSSDSDDPPDQNAGDQADSHRDQDNQQPRLEDQQHNKTKAASGSKRRRSDEYHDSYNHKKRRRAMNWDQSVPKFISPGPNLRKGHAHRSTKRKQRKSFRNNFTSHQCTVANKTKRTEDQESSQQKKRRKLMKFKSQLPKSMLASSEKIEESKESYSSKERRIHS